MSVITLCDVKLPIGKPESELIKIATKKLKTHPKYFAIKKKSLDARDKENIRFVYTIEFSAKEQPKTEKIYPKLPKEKQPENPVVIVGSGPAGLFCALRLLDYGITPVILERGDKVENREKKIADFTANRRLDVNSNVQFGEGGAGTFSDGKLNTQTHSSFNSEVLEIFVRHGAPKEILWLNKPHLGSDNLKNIVKNMREDILARGGKILFNTLLADLKIKDDTLTEITLKNTLNNREETLSPSFLVLAIGHSARDTFEKLYARGVQMRQKDFAVGVRIEHLQSAIGFAQYGKAYPLLPAADYKLVSKGTDRSAFTFCMCPGGVVMPATSEEKGVVVNGMSNYARNERNANSALIAQVRKEDFFSDYPLAGMEFQRKLERNAFTAGGESYRAPVQLVGDFLQGKTSDKFGEVLPSYGAGTTFADLNEVLPNFVTNALKYALTDMDRKLKGFANPDSVLTGVETRTSSPIRIERDETCQSVNVKGLYPCGEGAGYAGGITSSAADGLKVAGKIFERLTGING